MRRLGILVIAVSITSVGVLVGLWSAPSVGQTPGPRPPADAVQGAQQAAPVAESRPEQRKTEHDRSRAFDPSAAPPSSDVLPGQPDGGDVKGFDFSRDPFGAQKPMQTFEETMKADVDARPGVTAAQRKRLESRYDLQPKLDPSAKMSRGKPLAVGPTARLADGLSWDRLAAMSPDDVRGKKAFPYPALPHPKHSVGGMVFTSIQIQMFPRLQRFDVEFDIPDAFLPEFPPAI